jgi:hypothetical protein
MKDTNKRKRKIISVRLTDPELRELRLLMEANQLSASDLLREALFAFLLRQPLRSCNKTPMTARTA